MNNQKRKEIAPDVGVVIRNMRKNRGYSLRALSELSGLSINAISKIERGDNSPTVATLHKLSKALEVHITDLFLLTPGRTISFIQKGEESRINVRGIVIENLGRDLGNQKLEPFRMVIEPGAETIDDPVSHIGEEFVHCLKGEIEYFIGDSRYVLKPGDSLLFKASMPHGCRNSSDSPAHILVVYENDSDQPALHQPQNI
jgi:transcriptional regulator with XRE-family HTH domain